MTDSERVEYLKSYVEAGIKAAKNCDSIGIDDCVAVSDFKAGQLDVLYDIKKKLEVEFL